VPITESFDRVVAGYDFLTANPIEAQARAVYARNPLPELSAADFRATGGLTFVGQGGRGRSPFRGEKNNFLPRLGLAYKLGSRTVVRAGYGIYYDSLGVNKTTAQQTGFSQSTPIRASLDNGLTFVANNANPFPQGLIEARGAAGGLATSLGQGFSFYDPNQTHAYSQRWSFALQHMLPGQVVIEPGYTASRGTRLGVTRDFNALPNQYLSTSAARDDGRIASLALVFPNPFFGLAPSYIGTITRANLLRPYPQFGSLTAIASDGYTQSLSVDGAGWREKSRGRPVFRDGPI